LNGTVAVELNNKFLIVQTSTKKLIISMILVLGEIDFSIVGLISIGKDKSFASFK
jgi:hypothetical protein